MQKVDVLDHGFVRLVDHMGGDLWLSRRANRIKNNVALHEMRKLVAWLEIMLEAPKCAA